MQRLTGIDASFACLDVEAAPLGVAMVCTFDHETAPEPYSFARVRATVEGRLDRVPAFRRRLVDPPARLGRPRWIEDPGFALDRHLWRTSTPAPGGDRALATVAADALGRRFDWDRPLWDMTVIEGIGPARTASVTRVHHAAIDGVSGAEALANFLDLEPDPAEVAVPRDWQGEPLPSVAMLLADAAHAAADLPAQVTRRVARTTSAGLRLWRHARRRSRAIVPYPAPRTPLNGRLTARRAVAFSRIPLAQLDRARRSVGASVNDVLLALCAQSLRSYLRRRDALPARPLVAGVPVSVRDDRTVTAANQVSGMLVELPTDTADPVEQLVRTKAAAEQAKEQHAELGPHTVTDAAELAPAALLRTVATLERSIGLSSLLPPAINVVVSNFPGPALPLYFAGARLEAAYPFGPLAFGTGLNITAQSYDNTLHIGLNACPDLVDDVTEIAAGLEDGVTALVDEVRTAR